MWKTLGVETVKSQDERELALRDESGRREAELRQENEALKARVAELTAAVDRLSAKMGEVEKSSADIKRVEELVAGLEQRVDLIPRETLRKLAEILAKAADEPEAAEPGS
jgi:predicted  nucleic acid-binding Zn-ribbon protein